MPSRTAIPYSTNLFEMFNDITFDIAKIEQGEYTLRLCFFEPFRQMMRIVWVEDCVIAIRGPNKEEAFNRRIIIMRHPAPNRMLRHYTVGARKGEPCVHEQLGDPHQAKVGEAERHPSATWQRIAISIRACPMETGQHSNPTKQAAFQIGAKALIPDINDFGSASG
jgi:hypothetical protein